MRYICNQPNATTKMASENAMTADENQKNLPEPPSYEQATSPDCDVCACVLVVLSYVLVLACWPFAIFMCLKIVQEHERAVVFRLGNAKKVAEPGLFFTLPCIEVHKMIDMRSQTTQLPLPQIPTSNDDNSMATSITYRIDDALRATTAVEDVHNTLRLVAQFIIDEHSLDANTDCNVFAEQFKTRLSDEAAKWGVSIEQVKVDDKRWL